MPFMLSLHKYVIFSSNVKSKGSWNKKPLSEVIVTALSLAQVVGFPLMWSEFLPSFYHNLTNCAACAGVEIMALGLQYYVRTWRLLSSKFFCFIADYNKYKKRMIANTYIITKLPLASILTMDKVNINTYISGYKLL